MATATERQAKAFFDLLLGPPSSETGKPVGCVEMRAFEADINRANFVVKGDRYKKTIAGWFDRSDAFWAACQTLRGASAYLKVNPVNPALLARAQNRLAICNDTTKDKDILAVLQFGAFGYRAPGSLISQRCRRSFDEVEAVRQPD